MQGLCSVGRLQLSLGFAVSRLWCALVPRSRDQPVPHSRVACTSDSQESSKVRFRKAECLGTHAVLLTLNVSLT